MAGTVGEQIRARTGGNLRNPEFAPVEKTKVRKSQEDWRVEFGRYFLVPTRDGSPETPSPST